MNLKRWVCLLLVSLFGVILNGCGSSGNSAKNVTSEKQKPILVDSEKFARISTEELLKLMGTPSKTESIRATKTTTGEKVTGTAYHYERFNQKDYIEFLVFEDKVTKLNLFASKEYYRNGDNLPFTNENSLFEMFNVSKTDRVRKTADTGYALRFAPVSDKVADFWILGIDKNAKTFGTVKITYDVRYQF